MKLQRLRIERLAGIDRPFELEGLGKGLNIIIGPNGIGKSRICAAMRALLWHERGISGDRFTARADFEHEAARWQVVRDGSLHRWQREGIDATAPTLPGEHLEGCFFLGLRDLLDDSDRAGGDLASEIRKQMSGGFDLDAVEQRFASVLTKSTGKKESKTLNATEQAIQKAARGQADLERRERQIESLEARVAEAERASSRVAAFTTAISLQELRVDYAQRKSELGKLPEALANLDGKETMRLDRLEEDLVTKRAEREAADDAVSESREAALETRLDASIDRASLAIWRARAEKLAELEGRLETAEIAAAAASENARQCRRLLGSHAAPGPVPDLAEALRIEDDFDLFAFLRDSHQQATEREAVTERLRLLTARKFSDEDLRRLELLRRGVEPLRRWLRAPDPVLQVGAEALGTGWRNLIMIGVALVAMAATAKFFTSFLAALWLVAGAGVGLAAAGLWLRRNARAGAQRAGSTDWRAVAASQFPESLDPPADWSTDAVVKCLDWLEDELAKYDAKQKRALYRGVEQGSLEETLNGLKPRSVALEARRGVLFARLGLDIKRPDIEMVDLARALDASRAAHVEASRAAAKVKELEEHHSLLLARIATPLAELGEGEPIDAVSAQAGVRSLKDRDARLQSATEAQTREGKSRDRLDREIEGLETDRSGIFRIAGIEADDRAELTRLLSHLHRYRERVDEISKLVVLIEREESDLDAAGEVGLAGSSVAQLEEEKAKLERKSKNRSELDRQIVAIKLEAQNAREGRVLEDAIAKQGAAMSALRDRRDEALAALAGRSLVESVRREHETNQMPRVLERARSRFAHFTHQRYRLEVSPSDGGSFVAVDAKSGEGLSPDKLSDGTRAQLILAVRLAFAEEAEQGADLPLFLDEAMDHSDPERFHAIAVSLARMVGEEGRQIFYLTNDPTDVERFVSAFEEAGCDKPNLLDLAEIRGRAARVDRREVLGVVPLPDVPHPADHDAESYGVAIGISPLDPSLDVLAQHLYYVLRDDLSLLHEFLEARIESVGQCRNVLKGGSSALAESAATRSEVGVGLEARIELLEIFCLAWREGRGAPVGRLELEESDAVTEKYLDAVVEVAKEFEGDARRLIVALRERKDARLSGFRSRSADELEQFFVEHGQLDDRAVLSEAEIRERARGTPASNQLSPKVAAELVHQWWQLSQQTQMS